MNYSWNFTVGPRYRRKAQTVIRSSEFTHGFQWLFYSDSLDAIPRFTIRGIMIVMACGAPILTLLGEEKPHPLVALMGFTAGPICGAVIDIRRGRPGIQGGVIGGLLSYTCFWVVYLWLYFHSRRSPARAMGSVRSSAFFFCSSIGASIGLAVGILAWILMLPRRPQGMAERNR